MLTSDIPFVSVVSPVYQAADLVDLLVQKLMRVLHEITPYFEIILVDDGSPDNAWLEIMQNAQHYPQVKGVRLSRNYGQHQAISVGLEFSAGQWVVVLDCDLQDNPEEIPRLLDKALTGYKVVVVCRNNKKYSPADIFFSKIFNRLLSYFTYVTFDSRIGNFGLYHRDVITAIGQLRKNVQYFPLLVQWVNFPKATLETEHQERPLGTSSYNWSKKIKLATTVIFSSSDKPLRLAVLAGPLIALTAFLFTIFFFVRTQTGKYAILEYGSKTSNVWFFSGLFVFLLGITGFYLVKDLNKVKQQPIYLIKEKLNFKD